MTDERLQKQVVFGILEDQAEEEGHEEYGQLMWENGVIVIYTHSV